MPVDSVFSETGPLARAIPGYRPRAGQLLMARTAEGALSRGEVLAVEAPCGVGKSLAYLIPAITLAVERNQRVIVSTGMISLQEQLLGKDLPTLREALPYDFTFALAKGKSNFLCRHRLAEPDELLVNSQENAEHLARTIHALQLVEDEFPESRTGFRYPSIKAHALAHRGEYLSAALTILRAHALAGWPSANGRPKGSFEAWCRVVRDALVRAGLPDVEREPDDPSILPSQDRMALGALLTALYGAFGEDHVSVAEIVEQAYPKDGDGGDLKDAIEEIAPSRKKGKDRLPDRRSIGHALRRHRNRPCEGLVLRSCGRGGKTKTQLWQVRAMIPAGIAGMAGNESTPGQKTVKSLSEGSAEQSDIFPNGAGSHAVHARYARDRGLRLHSSYQESDYTTSHSGQGSATTRGDASDGATQSSIIDPHARARAHALGEQTGIFVSASPASPEATPAVVWEEGEL